VEGHNEKFFRREAPDRCPTIRSGATANGVYRSTVNSVGLLFCDRPI